MFKWLIDNLDYGKIILEIGSGYGTRELIKHWKVYSVEDIHDWAFKHACHDNYIYAPLVDDWYDLEVLKKQLPEKYDLILVDGPKGKEYRGGFIKNLDLFVTTVPIIIDDCQREVELDHLKTLSDIIGRPYEVFEERNNCKFGVI